jgi:heme-degrading monooxygenase HmoA
LRNIIAARWPLPSYVASVRRRFGHHPNVDPSKLDAYVAEARSRIQNARQLPGFRKFYLAVNRERARTVHITFWDTQEQHVPGDPNPENLARLQTEFGLQPEAVVVFEVVDGSAKRVLLRE